MLWHKTTDVARMFYPSQAPNKERLFIPRMESRGLSSPTFSNALEAMREEELRKRISSSPLYAILSP